MHDFIVSGVTLFAYFLFNAGAGAMLPPVPGQERTWYGWLYRTLQRLAANADRLAEYRFGPALVPPHVPLPADAAPHPAAPGGEAVRTTHVERIEASSVTYTD